MKKTVLILILSAVICPRLAAQYMDERLNNVSTINSLTAPPGAEQMQKKEEKEVKADTTAGFSLKAFARGYFRKDTLTPGYMFAGAVIVPGAGQIYNRDYWKLPIIYSGIGAGVYMGIHNNQIYQDCGDEKYKLYRNLSYVAAGLFYWGSLMDCVISYDTGIKRPVPAKSTLYSALLPGLGQAYNGDWWHIPIIYGGFAIGTYCYHSFDMEYKRFKYLYDLANDSSSGYSGAVSASTAASYKDIYRRYRDYSIVFMAAWYIINIVDANVFAYMADFDISDNIASVSLEPAVISPIGVQFASSNSFRPAWGVQMHLNF